MVVVVKNCHEVDYVGRDVEEWDEVDLILLECLEDADVDEHVNDIVVDDTKNDNEEDEGPLKVKKRITLTTRLWMRNLM